MISPDTFFTFSEFCFSGLLGGLKGETMALNYKKRNYISGSMPYMIVVFGTLFFNWNSVQ